jgi:N-acyl homoserine lactone hydrolase
MSAKELFFLPLGSVLVPKATLIRGGSVEDWIPVPSYAALVKTDDGNILFDTGLDPDGIRDPEGSFGYIASLITITKEDDISERLGQIGLTKDDIMAVILSHFHFDHAGAVRLFTKSAIYVQKQEYRYTVVSNEPPDSNLIVRKHWDHPLDYRLISGDTQVVPGVWVISTPGHTAGSQSVVVRLPQSGYYVITADAINISENIEKDCIPDISFDAGQSLDSMHRITNLASMVEGTIVPGHEPAMWERFKPLHGYR